MATAYEEEDGDFIFTRGTKRTKTRHSEQEATPFPTPPVPAAKRAKNPKESPTRREHPLISTSKKEEIQINHLTAQSDPDLQATSKKRKNTRSSAGNSQSGKTLERRPKVQSTPKNSRTPAEHNKTTLISLPLSDTPVINRNKELRKKGGNGARRSSLGLRGRRASSLIENGHSAIPHREVETSEFYKHIEAEGLSEPRRMKQLLTWTGERCMGPKPSHGVPRIAAELAARHVKESLLKDFANKSEFSDWFNRELALTKAIKKPNPRNVELENSLVAVEARLKILREERDKWRELAKPPPLLHPIFPPESVGLEFSHIDTSLLDPEQAEIFAEASSQPALELRKQSAERLRVLQSGLEPQVDQLADGIHKLEKYQETVGRVADKILSLSSLRLEERDRREKEEIGTRDLPMQEVLRSLSRILPDRKPQG